MRAFIQNTLSHLGVTRACSGYWLSIVTVELVVEDEQRMRSITKEVYEPAAALCSCSRHCVERNIRTVINKAWKANKAFLFEIAHRDLYAPPSVSEFIDMLVAYVLRSFH